MYTRKHVACVVWSACFFVVSPPPLTAFIFTISAPLVLASPQDSSLRFSWAARAALRRATYRGYAFFTYPQRKAKYRTSELHAHY